LIDFHLVGPEGRSGFTTAVVQDAMGYVWFGGWVTIKRYDGRRVEEYRIEGGNWTARLGTTINTLCVDGTGMLWAGGEGGLAHYDPSENRWIPVIPKSGESILSDGWIRTLLADGVGGLWFQTSKAVGRYRKGEGVVEVLRHQQGETGGLPKGRIEGLFRGKSEKVWIAVKGGVLLRAKPGGYLSERVIFSDALSSIKKTPPINALWEDENDIVWLGTADGLFRHDLASGTTRRIQAELPVCTYDGDSQVQTILRDRSGRLWLGTTKEGLHCFDEETLSVDVYKEDQPSRKCLPSNHIQALFQEPGGAIWVGTLQGTCRFDGRPECFSFFPTRDSDFVLPVSGSWHDVLLDREGVLWGATQGDGVFSLDRRHKTLIDHKNDPAGPPCLADRDIRNVEEGPGGELWFATSRTIRRHNRESGVSSYKRRVPVKNPDDGSEKINAFHVDADGVPWIGTRNCLERYDSREDRFIEIILPRLDLEKKRPRGVYPNGIYPAAEEGGLWVIGFCGELFFVDRRTGRVEPKPLSFPDGLTPKRGISCLADREDGFLWVGSDTGLLRYDKETGEMTRPLGGSWKSFVLSVLADAGGRIWVATQWKGIFCFDPSTEELMRFSSARAIHNSQFVTVSCHRAADDELFFATKLGILCFYPEKAILSVPTPWVRLMAFTVRGEPREFDCSAEKTGSLRLNSGENSISFEFASLDFYEVEKVEHAYRLLGAGEDWVYCGEQRRADFANLRGGSYRFQVKAANADGLWSEPFELARIEVAMAPSETWWFRSLLALGAILVVHLGWRWRARRIREANRRLDIKVRERTAALEEAQDALLKGERLAAIGQVTATVSHEIRNPLSTIAASVYSIRRSAVAGEEELDAPLRRIERNVARCVRITEDLLDFGRIPRFYREKTEIDTWLARALQSEDLPENLTVKTALNAGVTVKIDRHWVARCLLNLLMNAFEAVKGNGNGGAEVTVESRVVGSRLEFLVRDRGPGISPENMKEVFNPLFSTKNFGTGLGLPFVKRVTEQMNGGIEIASEEGRGTTATLWLRLQN
jgi:signal transduction histidine kinase/ligand-binding sensor domain-containing protein